MYRPEDPRHVLNGEVWLPTPLLPATSIGDRLGINLWLKREDCTPVGSFKLRGALVAMSSMKDQVQDSGVIVASAGNYGLAIAVAGQRYNVKVTVVLPQNANPSKIDRILLTGAELIQYGEDFDEAKDYARKRAEKFEVPYWEDGVIEDMALGSSTIADEILVHSLDWDYVLVPVGNGSLIKGISSVFKDRSPGTIVVGLVSDAAPSMGYAFQNKPWDKSQAPSTIGDGLSVRVPIMNMVHQLQDTVDEMWIVQESLLLPAVRTLIELEQMMVEPSAAVTVAAMVERRETLKGKTVSAILTGAHLNPSLLRQTISIDSLL